MPYERTLIACALLTACASSGAPPAATPVAAPVECCGIYELRQYTLHHGQRDTLIEIFDSHFVEGQEAAGMRIAGQFRDADDPDRFVWIRGFRDMIARPQALSAFYGGPVWQAHRERANATMVDSDNVLLLRPVEPASGFEAPRAARPKVGASELPGGMVVATIFYLNTTDYVAFASFFARSLAPALTEAGAAPIATFQSENAVNNYPRLPIREGEHVFLWFSSFESAAAAQARLDGLSRSPRWLEAQPRLSAFLTAPPQRLRLLPTARSLLR